MKSVNHDSSNNSISIIPSFILSQSYTNNNENSILNIIPQFFLENQKHKNKPKEYTQTEKITILDNIKVESKSNNIISLKLERSNGKRKRTFHIKKEIDDKDNNERRSNSNDSSKSPSRYSHREKSNQRSRSRSRRKYEHSSSEYRYMKKRKHHDSLDYDYYHRDHHRTTYDVYRAHQPTIIPPPRYQHTSYHRTRPPPSHFNYINQSYQTRMNSTRLIPPNEPKYDIVRILDTQLRNINNKNIILKINPNSRFFIIKCMHHEDIYASIKHSLWSSTRKGNHLIDQGYRISNTVSSLPNIYLLFSLNKSGEQKGIARMTSLVDFNRRSGIFKSESWPSCFGVEWIYLMNIPHSKFDHIRDKIGPVLNSRDATELGYRAGMKVLDVYRRILVGRGDDDSSCMDDIRSLETYVRR